MNKELIEMIDEFNRIKHKDNSNRIIICTLKPVETVTTAPNSIK